MESLGGSNFGDTYSERLRADTHRVVGGSLNLIRELARISQHIEGRLAAEWIVKRVQFFAYELQAHCNATAPKSERLALLNRFFFEDKSFSCVTDLALCKDPSEAFTLGPVLSERSGIPSVIALLYGFLAERIGVSLEFVDFKPRCFLKWSDDGRSRYIDINRRGVTLTSDELIEMMHTRFQMTAVCPVNLLETYSFESYLSDYIAALKTALIPRNEPLTLLYLQNILIAYQPSNLQLLAERARLHRQVGNFKSALSDLKRFFAFFERSKAPIELQQLHDELVQLFERQKMNIELID